MSRRLILLCLGAVAAALFAKHMVAEKPAFSSPDQAGRSRAIGEIRSLKKLEAKAFSDSPSFRAKTVPGAADWLANHPEPGQTFDQFLRTRRNRLEAPRTVLYLQPIGRFPPEAAAVLDQVKEYAAVFFQVDVELQPPLDPGELRITERRHPGTKERQFLTTDILTLLKKDLPENAYARLAVTMTDLYPDPAWNFVFGQASLRERTGVYSFARYGKPGAPVFLRRCARVLTHETGHMFGMLHCVHFQCLMNGSNHLDESDKTPLHLCPVCLRKLHAANRLDIRERYLDLGKFYGESGLDDDARWIKRRLGELED